MCIMIHTLNFQLHCNLIGFSKHVPFYRIYYLIGIVSKILDKIKGLTKGHVNNYLDRGVLNYYLEAKCTIDIFSKSTFLKANFRLKNCTV